ncbi:MAG: SprB repeat-containing protein, partial [Flavobacteriales bacterium]|nr:SprB repeat-containing protein [Flavobacteriales bacterium]
MRSRSKGFVVFCICTLYLMSCSLLYGASCTIDVSITAAGNVDCYGYCNGFVQSTVTGGSGALTYLWNDGQSTAQAIGLCAGTYCVT